MNTSESRTREEFGLWNLNKNCQKRRSGGGHETFDRVLRENSKRAERGKCDMGGIEADDDRVRTCGRVDVRFV